MVQALEKGNISPKLRKMGFLHKKRVIFSHNSDFDEILFSQKSLINRKKTTYPFTTSPGGTNPYNILLLLQAPAQRAARSAELPRSGGTGKRSKNSGERGARRQGLT